MKKLIAGLTILAAGAFACFAAMDSVTFSVPVIGVAAGATNAVTYVMRGHIESVYVAMTADHTGTVTIADSYGTIFSKATIGNGTKFYPRAANQTTAGVAYTYTTTGSTDTNTTTSAQSSRIAVAGPVTVTMVGETATTTNSAAAVTIIYEK